MARDQESWATQGLNLQRTIVHFYNGKIISPTKKGLVQHMLYKPLREDIVLSVQVLTTQTHHGSV
jgi:hypothetical protein